MSDQSEPPSQPSSRSGSPVRTVSDPITINTISSSKVECLPSYRCRVGSPLRVSSAPSGLALNPISSQRLNQQHCSAPSIFREIRSSQVRDNLDRSSEKDQFEIQITPSPDSRLTINESEYQFEENDLHYIGSHNWDTISEMDNQLNCEFSNRLTSNYFDRRSIHQIPIYVETLTGRTIEIQILPKETIYCLKMKIQEDEGIPLAQQHLIWQGKELENDCSLEEYGINFGAILRLVLELRGGPIVNLPSISGQNGDQTESFPESDKQDQEDERSGQNSDSGSVRFLIFQDGSEIRMTLALGSRDGNASGTGDSLSLKSADQGDFCKSLSKKNEQIEPIDLDRKRENDLLRLKVKEIQRKMRSLALKRRRGLFGDNRRLPTRLPMINDGQRESNHVTSQQPTIEVETEVHLPPLVPSIASSSRGQVRLEPISSNIEYNSRKLNFKTSGHFYVSKRTKFRLKSRSAKTLLRRSPRKQKMIDYNDPDRLSEDAGQGIGSFVETSSNEKRPKTTPSASKLVDSQLIESQVNLNLLNDNINQVESIERPGSTKWSTSNLNKGQMSDEQADKDDEKGSKTDKKPRSSTTTRSSTSSIVKSNQSKLDGPSEVTKKASKTLPPVSKVKSKIKSKNRCASCNKKLGLATKYDCRCGQMFCTVHRYSEAHECQHDYKSEGRRLIALNNPVVKAPKLPKI